LIEFNRSVNDYRQSTDQHNSHNIDKISALKNTICEHLAFMFDSEIQTDTGGERDKQTCQLTLLKRVRPAFEY